MFFSALPKRWFFALISKIKSFKHVLTYAIGILKCSKIKSFIANLSWLKSGAIKRCSNLSSSKRQSRPRNIGGIAQPAKEIISALFLFEEPQLTHVLIATRRPPSRAITHFLDAYPELVSIWSPKNQEQTDSIVPNEVEKRTFMWHCNSCNLDFKERMNTVLKRYLTSETKSLKRYLSLLHTSAPKPQNRINRRSKTTPYWKNGSRISMGAFQQSFHPLQQKLIGSVEGVRGNLKLESVNVKKTIIAVLTVLDEKYYQDIIHLMLRSQS